MTDDPDYDLGRDMELERRLVAAEERDAAHNDFIGAVWQAMDAKMDEDTIRELLDQALTNWVPKGER